MVTDGVCRFCFSICPAQQSHRLPVTNPVTFRAVISKSDQRQQPDPPSTRPPKRPRIWTWYGALSPTLRLYYQDRAGKCVSCERVREVRLNMVVREYRQYTPEEKERISRGACPCCGRERVHYTPGNEHTLCCQPSCSMEYWFKERPTVSGMRQLVRDEQGGRCARCKREVHECRADGSPHTRHHYVLDHIRPIAMGGDQWARDNLQVLCERCNRIKTARDMGNIARWKKYHGRGPVRPAGNFRQVPLLCENLT